MAQFIHFCYRGNIIYGIKHTTRYPLWISPVYQFTHNTKASYETDMKRICRYLQVTKDNDLVFNPSKKLLVGCYDDADFSGLWGHKNHQDHIVQREQYMSVVLTHKTEENCKKLRQIQFYSYHKYGLDVFYVPTVQKNLHHHNTPPIKKWA